MPWSVPLAQPLCPVFFGGMLRIAVSLAVNRVMIHLASSSSHARLMLVEVFIAITLVATIACVLPALRAASSIPQRAPGANEHRVRLHAAGFLAIDVSIRLLELGIFGFAPRSSLTELPVASGWFAILNRREFLALRAER